MPIVPRARVERQEESHAVILLAKATKANVAIGTSQPATTLARVSLVAVARVPRTKSEVG